MPSTYAHYRFGIEAIPLLSQEAQRSVGRFRQLYDVGLHGPDPFFHSNIFWHTAIGKLGSTMHELTGEEFFTRACKRLRMHPSEAGLSYLYGFLGHYVLDSLCHPFINQIVAEGKIGHVELESEFDRFLLELDDRKPPHRQDLSAHLHLTKNECATIAELLPPTTPANIMQATRNMALNVHLLATVNPKVIHTALKPMGRDIADQQMTDGPNSNCAYLDGRLVKLYKDALELYPVLARQMADHIDHRAPLGEDFQKTFG